MLWLTWLCVAASAQVQLGGVRQGYVLDESIQAIRPLIGTPGAAYLGAPIALPFPVSAASIRGNNAVVISNSRAFALQGLESGNPRMEDLGRAEAVFLDDDGSAGVLVNGSEIRLLRSNIAIDTGRVFSAVVFAQDCAILASKDGADTLLYRLCPNQAAVTQIRMLANVSADALAFTTQAGLFMTDRASNRVLLLRNPIDTGLLETLATEGIEDPAGLVSIGPREVAVAVSGSSKAVLLSDHEAPAWIDLPAKPDRMQSVLPNRLLSCTGVNDQPLLVIDLLQDRTPFFIPVLRGAP